MRERNHSPRIAGARFILAMLLQAVSQRTSLRDRAGRRGLAKGIGRTIVGCPPKFILIGARPAMSFPPIQRPNVHGNSDYQFFGLSLQRISELIRLSDMDSTAAGYRLERQQREAG